MRSDRLARRSSFLGRRIEIVFASEGIDLGRCLLCMHVGSSGPWKRSGKMRACVVAVAVLWPRCARNDFANRACASIFDGPLVFRGVGRAMGLCYDR